MKRTKSQSGLLKQEKRSVDTMVVSSNNVEIPKTMIQKSVDSLAVVSSHNVEQNTTVTRRTSKTSETKRNPPMKRAKSSSCLLKKPAPPPSRPRRSSRTKEEKTASHSDGDISSDDDIVVFKDGTRPKDSSGEVELLQLISEFCKMKIPSSLPSESQNEQLALEAAASRDKKTSLDLLIQDILSKRKEVVTSSTPLDEDSTIDSKIQEVMEYDTSTESLDLAKLSSLNGLTKMILSKKEVEAMTTTRDLDEDSTIASMDGATITSGMHDSLLGKPGVSDEGNEQAVLKTAIASIAAWRQTGTVGPGLKAFETVTAGN